MEKEKKENKIIIALKNILLYFETIFWVLIITLSLFGAIIFLPNDTNEYKDDWELMEEWRLKKEKRRK